MAMRIVEADCINCAACEPECPNTAISNTGTTFVVAAAQCTECVGAHDAPRCVEVCPVDCILQDPVGGEPKDVLLERYGRLHA
jgi:ferredoxin